MRAALVVHRVLPDRHANLRAILDGIARAARAGADLVLFAEAALSGLINDDVPAHDLSLGERIPGTVTDRLARAAAAHRLWLALGMLERAGARLYDTALLFTPGGEIGLRYRRIQPQWHGRDAHPSVYRQGTDLPALDTVHGRFAFLVCGDLFDNQIVARAHALRLDWLLFPFARCFSDGSWDQERWDEEEQPAYVARAQLVGATALIANYVAAPSLMGGAFGGALAVRADGDVLARLPLGVEGMLLVDLPRRQMPIACLQPSQLYISEAKLDSVMRTFDPQAPLSMPPLPVVRLGERIVLTDGHTRAYAAWSHGWTHVPVSWDTDDMDRDAYAICVDWCVAEGIRTVADLAPRVVDACAYGELWLERCARMHRARRNRR